MAPLEVLDTYSNFDEDFEESDDDERPEKP